MHKKLSAACIALLAVFLTAPQLAAAANTPLVVENGVAIASGTKFEGVNSGIIRLTGADPIECTTSIFTGEVTKNVTGNVEANITSVKLGGSGPLRVGTEEPECTNSGFLGNVSMTTNPGTNGLPWCLRSDSSMAGDEFQIRGNSCANASRPIRFAFDLTVETATCVYQRSLAMPGKFTTSTTSSTLSISETEFAKFEGPFICPGSLKLDLTLQLKTDGISTTLGITS